MALLKVNDRVIEVEPSDDTPLLWIIRDFVGLKGTKFGCGIGACGACTVHVDGEPARSCVTPVNKVIGSQITTIEGLDPNGNHPVQQAWVQLQVPQCGYCQSGQIMQAAALVKNNPDPSDEDIDMHMIGNFCRCKTYIRIRQAIKDAAVKMKEASS